MGALRKGIADRRTLLKDQPIRGPEKEPKPATCGNSRPLRIAVADTDRQVLAMYEDLLPALGHAVVCSVSSGKQLVDTCCVHVPEIVITDVDLDEMDGIEAALELSRLAPVAVVVVSSRCDEESIRRSTGDHVMAYLVKPIARSHLVATLPIARARFEQWKALHKEYYDASTAIRDRNLIDRAKMILMKRSGVTEEEAYRRLQKMSWEKNLKLVQIADMIATAEAAFEPE